MLLCGMSSTTGFYLIVTQKIYFCVVVVTGEQPSFFNLCCCIFCSVVSGYWQPNCNRTSFNRLLKNCVSVILLYIHYIIIYLIFIITLPQDVFSLFGACFGTLSVPILSLLNFESCGVLVCGWLQLWFLLVFGILNWYYCV